MSNKLLTYGEADSTIQMTLRLDYRKVAPEAVRVLSKVNSYISQSSVAPALRYLMEVRTSQINGCGYCIQVHRRQALEIGESVQRLDALGNWRESTHFSERERAALGWVEAVTLIAATGAPDQDYDALRGHFGDKEIVDLTFVIMSMNAWNRLAISFRREVAPT